MTKLKLSYKGKVVATIAVIVSFIILAWPFSGSKDAGFHNSMLAIAKIIVGIIYLVWQMIWHFRWYDCRKKSSTYTYKFFHESEPPRTIIQQKLDSESNRYVFTCIVCTIADICWLMGLLFGPVFISINSLVFNLTGIILAILSISTITINIVKLSCFTISYIHDFYKSFDFAEFVLNLPIVSDLFEQPANKEKEKPTKKIRM